MEESRAVDPAKDRETPRFSKAKECREKRFVEDKQEEEKSTYGTGGGKVNSSTAQLTRAHRHKTVEH